MNGVFNFSTLWQSANKSIGIISPLDCWNEFVDMFVFEAMRCCDRKTRFVLWNSLLHTRSVSVQRFYVAADLLWPHRIFFHVNVVRTDSHTQSDHTNMHHFRFQSKLNIISFVFICAETKIDASKNIRKFLQTYSTYYSILFAICGNRRWFMAI